jgi:hypothetical protein
VTTFLFSLLNLHILHFIYAAGREITNHRALLLRTWRVFKNSDECSWSNSQYSALKIRYRTHPRPDTPATSTPQPQPAYENASSYSPSCTVEVPMPTLWQKIQLKFMQASSIWTCRTNCHTSQYHRFHEGIFHVLSTLKSWWTSCSQFCVEKRLCHNGLVVRVWW